jgi:hypothetical protein
MTRIDFSSLDLSHCVLCSDARSVPLDYTDDQIWHLDLKNGEPPAISINSTFGLRVIQSRIFMRYQLDLLMISDPADFFQQPRFEDIYCNYAKISFKPFEDINVIIEFWVPESKSICCQHSVTNSSHKTLEFLIDVASQFNPKEGDVITVTKIQGANVLAGRSKGLEPVIFSTGGAYPGSVSYPSLEIKTDLLPEKTRTYRWVHYGDSTIERSDRSTRKILKRNWNSEIARQKMINSGLVTVRTGLPEWDAAFHLSQIAALNTFHGPTSYLPNRSFVENRLPDQGYSFAENGIDYGPLWSGQTPPILLNLTENILPSHTQLIREFLQNFYHIQEENGFIDNRPGLGGQRSRLLAYPSLATISKEYFDRTDDVGFIDQYFPSMLKFFDHWFIDAYDRDGDGIPEWSHPLQTGFDEHPVYEKNASWNSGVEIHVSETTLLCSLLFREAESLIYLSQKCEQLQFLEKLLEVKNRLDVFVQKSWDVEKKCYTDVDRNTHTTIQGLQLAKRNGEGVLYLDQKFESPVRLLISIKSSDDITRRPEIIIVGENAAGAHRVESVLPGDFRWQMGEGLHTGKSNFVFLHHIEIKNVHPLDRITVSTLDLGLLHISNFFPLWAGIPSRETADELIIETIQDEELFWSPFGISSVQMDLLGTDLTDRIFIQPAWNAMIGHGFVKYNHIRSASKLFTHLMTAIVKTLRTTGFFHRYYSVENGEGYGDHNHISGLVPLNFFLATLGIWIKNPSTVRVSGVNPYPWPVEIGYRGLKISKLMDHSIVQFPDKKSIEIDDELPKWVTID